MLADLALRAALFSALWWGFAEGRSIEWGFAVVAVGLATLLSRHLAGPRAIRLPGLVRFVPYFLLRSTIAGVDVARRALAPGETVRPGFLTLSLRLGSPRARIFYARVISLLPGTLAVQLEGRALVVHALDVESSVEATLREVEGRVAALFGER